MNNDGGNSSAESRKRVLEMESSVWQLAAKLRDFVELNYTAIYKIMKKHDKVTGIALMNKLLDEVEKMPFMRILDPPSAGSEGEGQNATSRLDQVLEHHNVIPEEEADQYLALPQRDRKQSLDNEIVSLSSLRADDFGGLGTGDTSLIDSESAHSTSRDQGLRIHAPQNTVSIPKSDLSSGNVVEEFRQELLQASRYVAASLRVMSPEMEDTSEESMKLERFATAARRAFRKLNYACKKDFPLEQIRAYALASKLELYRYMIKVIIREMELTYPEGAAALESLVHAHFDMFHMYMSSRVHKPSTKRVSMISDMLPTPYTSQMKELFRKEQRTKDDQQNPRDDKTLGGSRAMTHQGAKFKPQGKDTIYEAEQNEFPWDRIDEATLSQGEESIFANTHHSLGTAAGKQYTEKWGQPTANHYSLGSAPQKSGKNKPGPFSQKFWKPKSKRDDPRNLPSEQNPFQHRSLAPRQEKEDTSTIKQGQEAKPQPKYNRTTPALARAVAKLLKPVYQDRAINAADRKKKLERKGSVLPPADGTQGNGQTTTAENLDEGTSFNFALSQLVGEDKGEYEPGPEIDYSFVEEKDDGRCDCSRFCNKRNVKKLLPNIFDWLPEYNFRKHLKKDLLAGLTDAVVLIPQGLSRALLAGVPPVFGIYTGIAPAIVYGFFGTARHAFIGPMSIPALMVASAVENFQPVPTGSEYIRLVMSISFLVGIFCFILGLLRFGFVVNFISRPVLKGFTSAASVIAILSVVGDIFGTSIPKTDRLHETLEEIGSAVPNIHAPTFIFSLSSLIIILAYRKTRAGKKVPSPLAAVVFFILLMLLWYGIDGSSFSSEKNGLGIEVIGDIPDDLPSPEIPTFSNSELIQLIPTAITISFVAYIEHVAVAKNYSMKFGYETDASQELRSVGLANIFGAIFQSFPVMGGFSMSAINVQAGARTLLAPMISGIIVLCLLLAITPALFFLPRSVLAVLVVVSVMGLIDVKSVARLWKEDRRDLFIMALAFFLTLFLGVQFGVLAAMGASLLLFIYVSTHARVAELGRVPGTVVYRHVGLVGVVPVRNVKIIKFYAPLYFANVGTLKDALARELTKRKRAPPRLKWKALVLSMASVPSIDSTAVQVLEEMIDDYHKEGVPVVLSSPNSGVEKSLASAGVVEKLGGPLFVYRRVHEAVRAVLMNAIHLKERNESNSLGNQDSQKSAKEKGGKSCFGSVSKLVSRSNRRRASSTTSRCSSTKSVTDGSQRKAETSTTTACALVGPVSTKQTESKASVSFKDDVV